MPSGLPQITGTLPLATVALISGISGLVILVLSIIISWRIFSKAGYSGALGLLMFIPVANIVALFMLAFGTWPIYRELNQFRQGARIDRGQRFSQGVQNPQYR